MKKLDGLSRQDIISKGGRIILIDTEADDGKELVLSRKSAEEGLKLMAELEPLHFSNFITEQDDRETADVWLQCTLLGMAIYG